MNVYKTILAILLLSIFSLNTTNFPVQEVTKLKMFSFVSFYAKYEMYCSSTPTGYFKYPSKVAEKTYYFTYEGKEFFRQSQFDENFFIYNFPTTAHIYSNNRGELLRLKKGYAPVSKTDRKALNSPYGYSHSSKKIINEPLPATN